MHQIQRRMGLTPQQRGSTKNQSCPDFFRLTDGNFAGIGERATEGELAQLSTVGASVAPTEAYVIFPRQMILPAFAQVIVDALTGRDTSTFRETLIYVPQLLRRELTERLRAWLDYFRLLVTTRLAPRLT